MAVENLSEPPFTIKKIDSDERYTLSGLYEAASIFTRRARQLIAMERGDGIRNPNYTGAGKYAVLTFEKDDSFYDMHFNRDISCSLSRTKTEPGEGLNITKEFFMVGFSKLNENAKVDIMYMNVDVKDGEPTIVNLRNSQEALDKIDTMLGVVDWPLLAKQSNF